jgi:hypothetical protein
MKGGCQTRLAARTLPQRRKARPFGARVAAPGNRRHGREDGAFLAATRATPATRRACGGSSSLLALPLLDRLAAETPVAADAKPRQTPLPEQAVDGGRMYPQVLRQLLDGENLIARRYLGHALAASALRRDLSRRPFLHSLQPPDIELQYWQPTASVVALAESRHFVRVAGRGCLQMRERTSTCVR